MAFWRINPKSLEELELAIRGEGFAPKELIEFRYRERFHLSYKEMMDEPIDTFNVNLKIMEIEERIGTEIETRKMMKAENYGNKL